MITLTHTQREVLAYVVIDPDQWVVGAVAGLGEKAAKKALVAKVKRWEPDYTDAKAGPNYQTRAERESQNT